MSILVHRFIIIASLLFAAAFAQDLGDIDFPTSGSTVAQESFEKGVLLLHSFEYVDARSAFRQAMKSDKDFAMAYWGMAMTHNQPIWNAQDLDAGRSALRKIGDTLEERLAKAGTEKEKGWLRAVNVLYFHKGDKLARDLAYSAAMKELSERYPDDLEMKSFYALSILGTAQAKRDFRIYMRAGAIAGEVFEENPRHPGAAHYVIHSFDDPIHAPLGLKAAHAYAKIAPDAPHALHMPSHIFMALGMWDESSRMNEASAAASHKKGRRGYHATWWLTYSYLQSGRYADARKLIERLEANMKNSPDRATRNHLAYMRAAYVIETRDWDPLHFEPEIDFDNIRLQASSTTLFAKGLATAQKGRTEAARKYLRELKSLPESSARYNDAETANLMYRQLEAAILVAEFKVDDAISILKRAVKQQEDMEYEFGPAMPVKPVYEQFGETLLANDRAEEAVEMFRKSLLREPGRVLSLLGLARSSRKIGDKETSKRAYQTLAEIWHQADDDVKGRAEVPVSLGSSN